MRYDTPIYFRNIIKGKYDSKTGNYDDDIVEETTVYASVSDTGSEMLKLVYGTVKQDSKIIRLQSIYKGVYDSIRIGSSIFKVGYEKKLRTKQVLIVSEVQNG